MLDLAVLDACWLMNARSRPEQHLANALVLEPHPASQHINHLEVEVVPVPFSRGFLSRPSPDDVGIEPPGSRLSDPKVTVLEERSQAIMGIVALVGMAHGEFHFGPPPVFHPGCHDPAWLGRAQRNEAEGPDALAKHLRKCGPT